MAPIPIPCEDGSYTNTTAQSECVSCDEGFYCVDASKEVETTLRAFNSIDLTNYS